jgi:hypothetical protein
MLDQFFYQQGKQWNIFYHYANDNMVDNMVSFLNKKGINLFILKEQKEPLLERLSFSGNIDIKQLKENNILIKKTQNGFTAYLLATGSFKDVDSSFYIHMNPAMKVLLSVLCYYAQNDLIENNMVIDAIHNNTKQGTNKISFALGMILSKEWFEKCCVESGDLLKKEEQFVCDLNNIAQMYGFPYNFVKFAFEEYKSQINFDDLFKKQSPKKEKEQRYSSRKQNYNTDGFVSEALALTTGIGLSALGADLFFDIIS